MSVQLLMTRPQEASQRFLAAVSEEMGRPVTALVSPLLRLVTLEVDVALRPGERVIFTSQAGVAAFAARGGVAQGAAWCVGARTAEAAQALGFAIAGVALDADELVAGVAQSAGPLVHLHGRYTRGDVMGRLSARGLELRSLCLYDQVAQPLSAEAVTLLETKTSVCVALFSPRTATLFAQKVPSNLKAKVFLCSMSEAVARAAAGIAAAEHVTAPEPTARAMVLAVANRLRSTEPT